MSFFKQLFGKKKLDYRKRYDLLQEAISGTMSQVYKARDKETGQLVAVKILDMQITQKIDARWKGVRKPTEGEISILFDHPYIVKTLDQGLTTDGEQYLIMEYLEGTGLNNVLLIPHDMMAGSRTFYMRQVAEALAEVHKKGFIHHDICPRNLLFSGDASVLKLTDFGLTLPNQPPFTDPGNRTGTANYMAPELVRRKSTDIRLDIFSFGVTMYEMFTNELPWPRGSSDDPTASAKAAMSHSETPAPITKYRPQIHPVIAKAIHSCIEPDMNKRCPDMPHFLRMIKNADSDDREN
ncbi:MAG: serine/threonine protein kinase [Planctomycetaceae bacterium]|nr:serine/threonine protein kinase [Planctomycetaceae bacterium]